MPISPGGDFAQALLRVLMAVLPDLIKQATDALATLTGERAQAVWNSVGENLQHSELNFITRTPAGLSYNLGSVADLYGQWEPAFLGVGALACVCGGLAALGREYLGWSWSVGEWSTRVVLGILLALSAPRIYIWSISFVNVVCDSIVGTSLPSSPAPPSLDPLTSALILVVWVVLGFRLLCRMAYWLVFFDILLIVGPIALAAYAIPGGSPYAKMWMKSYVGLLLGKILVTIALRIASSIGNPLGGSIAGVALGVGVLILAYDLATMFTAIPGGGLMGIVRKTAGLARGKV